MNLHYLTIQIGRNMKQISLLPLSLIHIYWHMPLIKSRSYPALWSSLYVLFPVDIHEMYSDIMSVSYTHLDVYKRQLIIHAITYATQHMIHAAVCIHWMQAYCPFHDVHHPVRQPLC